MFFEKSPGKQKTKENDPVLIARFREGTKERIGKENNIVITSMDEPNEDETESIKDVDRRNIEEILKEAYMPRTDKIIKNI